MKLIKNHQSCFECCRSRSIDGGNKALLEPEPTTMISVSLVEFLLVRNSYLLTATDQTTFRFFARFRTERKLKTVSKNCCSVNERRSKKNENFCKYLKEKQKQITLRLSVFLMPSAMQLLTSGRSWKTNSEREREWNNDHETASEKAFKTNLLPVFACLPNRMDLFSLILFFRKIQLFGEWRFLVEVESMINVAEFYRNLLECWRGLLGSWTHVAIILS